MANILDRYGIKEVADVTFYKLDSEGKPTIPVLYLDTLKVSTIEQTAENTSARGGKGNSELVTWDYGKEINVTLEDALFSAKSMAIMYGATPDKSSVDFKSTTSLMRTVPIADVDVSKSTFSINGKSVAATNIAYYDEYGASTTDNSDSKAVYATGNITVVGQEIVISADTFPGAYYITGDTYARSEATNEDQFFQFIIPKAKVLSEVTLTLEAEGDPSTFSMNLKVLRPKNGEMMKLVQYTIGE